MAITINNEIRELLRDKQTLKVLASVDKTGKPHVAFKGSIDVDEDGNLYYLEVLESSQTNKNLTNSIWFDKYVAINIFGANKKSYQIKGIPVKLHISGPLFEEKYKQAVEKHPGIGISGIWVIRQKKSKRKPSL
ncbi:pyridoxamine 5'-phosphate oxidase family protein [Ruminiclostridium josui]|uniref:pyridoxamine 5'-phosphate oxidase family protein n=1 Tax=Ruminiclostridium josui TaxID=1499 RepID=UPI0006CF8578|nr:pyridoxamine 5'-phosphate oxidase family protein [Ruminiclostridium josui]